MKKIMVTAIMIFMIFSFMGATSEVSAKSYKVNSVFNTSKVIRGKAKKRAKVVVKAGGKKYAVKVNKRGKFKVKLKQSLKKKIGTKVTVKFYKRTSKGKWKKVGAMNTYILTKSVKLNDITDTTRTIHGYTYPGYVVKLEMDGINYQTVATKKTGGFSISTGKIVKDNDYTLKVYKKSGKLVKALTHTAGSKDAEKLVNQNEENGEADIYTMSWREYYLEDDIYDIEVVNDYLLYDKSDTTRPYCFVWGDAYECTEWYSKEDYEKMIAVIKQIVESAHLTEEQTEQEKLFRIYRACGCFFKGQTQTKHTLKEALLERHGMCDGRSKVYAVCCRYVGLKSEFIGTVHDKTIGVANGHAQVLIKMGQYWYFTDPQHCDYIASSNSTVIRVGKTQFGAGMDSEWDVPTKADVYWRQEKFLSAHLIDNYGYGYRCTLEGIPHLTADELYECTSDIQ